MSTLIVALCGLSVVVALVPLVLIFSYVISQGITALNLEFFHAHASTGGRTGRRYGQRRRRHVDSHQPRIAVGDSHRHHERCVHVGEYAGTRRLRRLVRFAADTLNGVPSIVMGVFVYGFAVLPFKQFSALAGGTALGIMMIPKSSPVPQRSCCCWYRGH